MLHDYSGRRPGGRGPGNGADRARHRPRSQDPVRYGGGRHELRSPPTSESWPTAGANIIVDDVSYFAEPFYQDGPIAKAVNDVRAAGVDYFSSAANNNIIVGGHDVASYEAVDGYRATTCPPALTKSPIPTVTTSTPQWRGRPDLWTVTSIGPVDDRRARLGRAAVRCQDRLRAVHPQLRMAAWRSPVPTIATRGPTARSRLSRWPALTPEAGLSVVVARYGGNTRTPMPRRDSSSLPHQQRRSGERCGVPDADRHRRHRPDHFRTQRHFRCNLHGRVGRAGLAEHGDGLFLARSGDAAVRPGRRHDAGRAAGDTASAGQARHHRVALRHQHVLRLVRRQPLAVLRHVRCSAHAAAVAALLLQQNPQLTPTQLNAALASTAADLGLPAAVQGSGLIDAAAAGAAVVPKAQTITSPSRRKPRSAARGPWTRRRRPACRSPSRLRRRRVRRSVHGLRSARCHGELPQSRIVRRRREPARQCALPDRAEGHEDHRRAHGPQRDNEVAAAGLVGKNTPRRSPQRAATRR